MKILTRVCFYLALGLGACLMANADVYDLFPPTGKTLGDSSLGQDIGPYQIGVLFDAVTSFSINGAAIQFNPFKDETSQIEVLIYAVTVNSDNNGDGDLGSLLSSATAGITDSGLQLYDVPIDFSFTAGDRYAVVFADTDPTYPGWGTGADNTERNLMTFWEWDPAITGDTPFAVGPVSVIDGVYVGDGGFRNENFPAVELSTVPEPRLAGFLAFALLVALLVRKAAPVRQA